MKAIIFDFDGTLADTHKVHLKSWIGVAEEESISLVPSDVESLRGLGRFEALDVVLRHAKATYNQQDRLRLADKKNLLYLQLLSSLPTAALVFPGVLELLGDLTRRAIPLAVASSSKNARCMLLKTGLGPFFTAILDGNDVRKAKPDPEVFLKAAEYLRVRPDQCLVVEDAMAGIQAAWAAGMAVFGIGSPEVLREVDDIAPSISEVTADRLLAAARRQSTR